MTDYSNFPIFIEPELKHAYQEQSIRKRNEYWLQINCVDGQYLDVSNIY